MVSGSFVSLIKKNNNKGDGGTDMERDTTTSCVYHQKAARDGGGTGSGATEHSRLPFAGKAGVPVEGFLTAGLGGSVQCQGSRVGRRDRPVPGPLSVPSGPGPVRVKPRHRPLVRRSASLD